MKLPIKGISSAAYAGAVITCGLALLYHGITNASALDLGCGILVCLIVAAKALLGARIYSTGWAMVGAALAVVLLIANEVVQVLTAATLVYVLVLGAVTVVERRYRGD